MESLDIFRYILPDFNNALTLLTGLIFVWLFHLKENKKKIKKGLLVEEDSKLDLLVGFGFDFFATCLLYGVFTFPNVTLNPIAVLSLGVGGKNSGPQLIKALSGIFSKTNLED